MIMLKTIATGSDGNAHAIKCDNKILIVDLGVSEITIKKGIGYRISDVAGCVVTHGHL